MRYTLFALVAILAIATAFALPHSAPPLAAVTPASHVSIQWENCGRNCPDITATMPAVNSSIVVRAAPHAKLPDKPAADNAHPQSDSCGCPLSSKGRLKRESLPMRLVSNPARPGDKL